MKNEPDELNRKHPPSESVHKQRLISVLVNISTREIRRGGLKQDALKTWKDFRTGIRLARKWDGIDDEDFYQALKSRFGPIIKLHEEPLATAADWRDFVKLAFPHLRDGTNFDSTSLPVKVSPANRRLWVSYRVMLTPAEEKQRRKLKPPTRAEKVLNDMIHRRLASADPKPPQRSSTPSSESPAPMSEPRTHSPSGLTTVLEVREPKVMRGGAKTVKQAVKIFDTLAAELDRQREKALKDLEPCLHNLPAIHFDSIDERRAFERSLSALLDRVEKRLVIDNKDEPSPPSILRCATMRDGYFRLEYFRDGKKHFVNLGEQLPSLGLADPSPDARRRTE